MSRIVLHPHKRPRILAVNFTPAEVKKLQDGGWSARRGATGLHDGGDFCIPGALQDFEVLLLRIEEGAFEAAKRPSEDSVVKEPTFAALVHDLWVRGGWTLVFVATSKPDDLSGIALAEDLGVRMFRGLPFPRHLDPPKGVSAPPLFPVFLGQTVWVAEGEPEGEILRAFMNAMRAPRILDAKPFARHEYGEPNRTWIAGDHSGTGCALAVRFDPQGAYREPHGGILVLPDFNDSVAVAVALLEGSVVNANPALFDSPESPWLNAYLPHPARELEEQRCAFEKDAGARLLAFEARRDEEIGRYRWLLQLLTSEGSDLVAATAKAFEYLGYTVRDMDEAEAVAKREDLRITDGSFLALVEVKGTKRGPAEDFIGQAIEHANRYARETNGPPPPCVLLVNHSRLLPPDRRPAFYAATHVKDRLARNGIIAIDSGALHQACQAVLAGNASLESVRARIRVPGIVEF